MFKKKQPTYEGITSGIRAMVTKLDELADHHGEHEDCKLCELEDLRVEVENRERELQLDIDLHKEEKVRAKRTAASFTKLLDGNL